MQNSGKNLKYKLINGIKVAFFRECDSFFKSPNFQKKYSKKTILSLKSKFPGNNSKVFLVGNLNFKFRVSSLLEY